MASTYFPLRNLEFGYVPGRDMQHDQIPIKTLSTKSLTDLPGRLHFICVVTTHCWGELSASCVTPLKEDLGSLYLVSLDFIPNVFSLC